MTDEIVGIDLGTTNSELALYRDGRPEILADEQGRKILPSVVGLTEAGKSWWARRPATSGCCIQIVPCARSSGTWAIPRRCAWRERTTRRRRSQRSS